MATSLTGVSAAALSDLVRRGEATSVEVVEAYLDRISSVDPEVAAYVTVLADRALASARALDAEQRAGVLRGPLHGVPVAVKDIFAVRGVPMTAGSSFLAAPSAYDAEAVRRLEAAGAVVLGTTTLHEFALGMTSLNPHGRTPRNPWDSGRIAGGSSGGSAAAVAAGLAAAALGTDTGGSIRIPTALCGIVGLKPTFGRVSRYGVLPLAASFDTVGPMTRTVEDAALVLEVLAGHDPRDPDCSAIPAEPYARASRGGWAALRIGRLVGRPFEEDLDPAAARAVDEVARAAEREGFSLRPVRLRTAEDGQQAQVTLLLAEAAAFHERAYPGQRHRYGPDVRLLLDQGASTTDAAIAAARAAQGSVIAEFEEVFRDVDLLLGPAMPIGAPYLANAAPHGEAWIALRRRLGRFSRLYNLAGLPAIVLPAGLTAEGLPVAAQMAAGRFNESLLLGAALRIEQAIGWVLPDLPRRA